MTNRTQMPECQGITHPLGFELDLAFKFCGLSLSNEFFFDFPRESRIYPFRLAELL